MILVIDGHSYLYEMESLCDIFFPYEKVTAVYENGHDDSLWSTQVTKKKTERLIYTFL